MSRPAPVMRLLLELAAILIVLAVTVVLIRLLPTAGYIRPLAEKEAIATPLSTYSAVLVSPSAMVWAALVRVAQRLVEVLAALLQHSMGLLFHTVSSLLVLRRTANPPGGGGGGGALMGEVLGPNEPSIPAGYGAHGRVIVYY